MADRANCLDCGTTLGAPRKGNLATGYCRRCNPKRKWTDEHRAKASASRKARWARDLAGAAGRAAAVESGKRLRERFGSTPEMIAKQNAGRRRSHWCPEGYEGLNRQLKAKGFLAAERKQMIATEVLREAERRDSAKRAAASPPSALSPFEHQLERVRNGAKLIAKPDFRTSGPAYTLGGVAPEAL